MPKPKSESVLALRSCAPDPSRFITCTWVEGPDWQTVWVPGVRLEMNASRPSGSGTGETL